MGPHAFTCGNRGATVKYRHERIASMGPHAFTCGNGGKGILKQRKRFLGDFRAPLLGGGPCSSFGQPKGQKTRTGTSIERLCEMP
jgi:hypothetical protein